MGVDVHTLRGNPYFLFGRRPVREARVAAYIIREHRRGRTVAEILDDAYVARCGGRTVAWHALVRPETIEALGHDACDAIAQLRLH